jgi:hypothetical protein
MFNETTEIVFEEKAGFVPITVNRLHDESIWCELGHSNFQIPKSPND